jgi:hypothetical protein
MIQSLFPHVRQQIQSWFTKAQNVTQSDDDLIELPDTLLAELNQRLESLSSPKAYQTTIQEAIATGVATWQKNLEAANHLVILAHPVEAIAKILQDSFDHWQNPPPLEIIIPFLSLHRPRNPINLSQRIQQSLQPYPQIHLNPSQKTDRSLDVDALEERQTLIVIPCLEQCFLRSIGGWESVELLRDLMIQNPHCFWVIGCNHWAWDFLDFVCQVSAYFSEIQTLPKLDATVLEDWLSPITQNPIVPKLVSGEDPEPAKTYWEALASQSSGVSQIAAYLWLQSLRIKSDAITEDEVPSLNSPDIILYETKPYLPSLPTLETSDRYLLHSVLIHGSITRSHLALSLGEPESQIQARVQWLLRADLLEAKQGGLSLHPVHYDNLVRELSNNNFFVGKL